MSISTGRRPILSRFRQQGLSLDSELRLASDVLKLPRHNVIKPPIVLGDHAYNPFTPEGDQCQNSPAASQEIWHHTVWRTWLFIAYSDEKWLYYKFSLHHSYHRFLKGWENTLFELRSERVKQPAQSRSMRQNVTKYKDTIYYPGKNAVYYVMLKGGIHPYCTSCSIRWLLILLRLFRALLQRSFAKVMALFSPVFFFIFLRPKVQSQCFGFAVSKFPVWSCTFLPCAKWH